MFLSQSPTLVLAVAAGGDSRGGFLLGDDKMTVVEAIVVTVGSFALAIGGAYFMMWLWPKIWR